MMRYKCSTCEYTFAMFAEVIDHMIIKHLQDELRIRKLVENDPAKSILWQTKNSKWRLQLSKIMGVSFTVNQKFNENPPI